ncbi:dihydrofolate reductase [Coemansia erecta]|uniref:Dihydrofolate reductase n=1 Tax=Coemansia erecta TaxID=147472 RepID=A0A9W8CQX8_9FUNG|nr:dihydrofolate reductase [Coemansia erecta]
MTAKPLTLIVAAASSNGAIGRNNDIPWRLRNELGYFHKVTTAAPAHTMNACILGRLCWLSIPPRHRPLASRYNIILTSDPSILDSAAGAAGAAMPPPPFTVTRPSLAAALEHIDELNRGSEVKIDRVFVCGGRGVYAEALGAPGHVQILRTDVRLDEEEAKKCDVFFPEVDQQLFVRQTHERLEQVAGVPVPRGLQTEAGIQYEFQLYEKTPLPLEESRS